MPIDDDLTCAIENEEFNKENGRCQCGVTDSCADASLKNPYCDPTQNACKCSTTLNPCTNEYEVCNNGACTCGTADTCFYNAITSYCEAANSKCTRKHIVTCTSPNVMMGP